MLLAVWYALKYRGARLVTSRDELEDALRAAPRRIIVEGNEALRAYASTLAYRGGEKAAQLEAENTKGAGPAGSPTYMVVPTVGRIRDGYRDRRVRAKPKIGMRMKAGMGTVVLAATGIGAALLVELLSIPDTDPELIRGPRHAGIDLLAQGSKAKLPTHAPPPLPPTPWEVASSILVPVLAVLAAAALLYLFWQAFGPGRPVKISWRVENRVQGRLVMARVKTRIA